MLDRHLPRPLKLLSAATLAVMALAAVLLAGSASAAPEDIVADQVFGQPDFASDALNNGGVSASSMALPGEVAIDDAGNVYITDSRNNRVLQYNDPLTTDNVADRVFGQPDFTSNADNNGGVSASSLSGPTGLELDTAGNLYVADQNNNRVLVYNDPLTTDTVADRVFGQMDFTSNAGNNGGVGASSLNAPAGVTIDSAGNVYVVDVSNNRVLQYSDPLNTDTVANRVFGQPDFVANLSNTGGISASTLRSPWGVAVDAAANLYIADYGNDRVLQYNDPLNTDTTADRVFGQPDFISNDDNNGGISASSLNGPDGVAIDAAGSLYVADYDNSRVLQYDSPLTTDRIADRVIGQPDFTSNVGNNGGISASSINGPFGLAVDGADNLYVSDYDNNRVLRYSPAAVTTMLWGDSDCDGDITTRDNQALLRNVLQQNALSQTEPCADLGATATVGGTERTWGDWDCDGTVTTRDNQALLRKVLDQNPLGQTEPCPDIGVQA